MLFTDFSVTSVFIAGIIGAIIGTALLLTALRISRTAKAQAGLTPNVKYNEPKSVFIFEIVGILLFAPLFLVAFEQLLLLSDEPGLAVGGAVLSAAIGIALLIAAVRVKGNDTTTTALRLGSILSFIWTVSAVFSIYSDFSAPAITLIIIGIVFLAIPNLLTREIKYQTAFRLSGIVLLIWVITAP